MNTTTKLGMLLVLVAGCFLPEAKKKEPAQADPCTSCAAAACTDTYSACTADSSCIQLVSCIFACPAEDDACFNSCLANDQAAAGIGLALALAECTGTNCSGACPAIPGAAGGMGGAAAGGMGGVAAGGTGGTGGVGGN